MSVAGSRLFRHATGVREALVVVTVDYTNIHEVVGGLTLTAASWSVFLNGAASTHFTLSGQAVDGTGKMAQVKVTDVAAVSGAIYHLVCSPTLSDGSSPAVETVELPVEDA
jgi:hypothetical protein